MAIHPALIQDIIDKGLDLNKPHNVLGEDGLLKANINNKINIINIEIGKPLNESKETLDESISNEKSENLKAETDNIIEIKSANDVVDEESIAEVAETAKLSSESDASLQPQVPSVKRGRKSKNS